MLGSYALDGRNRPPTLDSYLLCMDAGSVLVLRHGRWGGFAVIVW